jgi:hypothetical protein
MTKLDDLRQFLKDKNKKEDDSGNKKLPNSQETEYSLEVGGTTANPLASFGTEETDPDIVSQVYSSPRKSPKGRGS